MVMQAPLGVWSEACERGRKEVAGDCAVAEWERNRPYAEYVLIVDVRRQFQGRTHDGEHQISCTNVRIKAAAAW